MPGTKALGRPPGAQGQAASKTQAPLPSLTQLLPMRLDRNTLSSRKVTIKIASIKQSKDLPNKRVTC